MEGGNPEAGTVSALLLAWSKGDEGALAQVTPIVYGELRRLASHYMRNERIGHTLQPTALVHEAYARLVDYKRMEWQSRAHFFAVAGQVMRRILVDHARRRNVKRGADFRHLRLDEIVIGGPCTPSDPDLLALDRALNRLSQFDARKVRVVELRYFAGLSVEETAEALNLSTITIKREWRAARTWLYGELTGAADASRTLEAN